MRKTTINDDNDHPGKIHCDFFLAPTKEDRQKKTPSSTSIIQYTKVISTIHSYFETEALTQAQQVQ